MRFRSSRRRQFEWLLTRTSYGIGESFSSDRGATWSEVVPSPGLKHTVSRFFITRLASGKLLLVKNGPIDQDVGRSQMMAFLSRDDGQSWYGGLMLDQRTKVSYPDGVEAANGMIYVIYDHARHEEKEILLAAFTEADVAAGQSVSEQTRFRLLVNKGQGINPRFAVPAAHRFLSGENADVKSPEGTEQLVEPGAVLFTDRSYVWNEIPDEIQGKQYVRMSIDGGEVRVTRSGICYVATPLTTRNRDSLQVSLIQQGFERSDVDEFSIFEHTNKEATLCSLFQKSVQAGETIWIGKWGVVVF